MFPDNKAGGFAPGQNTWTLSHCLPTEFIYKNIISKKHTLRVKIDTASLFNISAKHIKIPTQSISCRKLLTTRYKQINFNLKNKVLFQLHVTLSGTETALSKVKFKYTILTGAPTIAVTTARFNHQEKYTLNT